MISILVTIPTQQNSKANPRAEVERAYQEALTNRTAGVKERLLQDENIYSNAKEMVNLNPNFAKETDLGIRSQKLQDSLNAFSPQAKKEMGALKSLHGDDWTHQAQTSEFRHYLDNSGIIQGKPQYRGDRTIPSNEFYWNGKTPIDTQYEHLNPKSSGFNFWDETGGHGLQEGTSTLEELQKIFSKYNP